MRISRVFFPFLALFTLILAVTRMVEAAVTMESYSAAWLGNHQQVLVQWKTATEVSNAGFRLYRSDSANFAPGTQNRIATVISQNGGSPIGATYVYTDTPPGFQTFYYILQAVDINAATEEFGPFPALDATPTLTPTATNTAQATATATNTVPATATASATATPSPSPTSTVAPGATPVATVTPGLPVANPAQPQPPLPPAFQPQSFPPTLTPFPTPTALEIAQALQTSTVLAPLASPPPTRAAPSPTARASDSSSDNPFGLVQIVYATGLVTLLGLGCFGFAILAVAGLLLWRHYKR